MNSYFPVPVRLTVCGLLLALSLMFMVAVRVPVACGVNVTEIVHLALLATLLPQVLVSAKSPGSVPVNVTSVKLRAVGSSLVKVTFLAALVVPTVVEAKVSVVGVQLT